MVAPRSAVSLAPAPSTLAGLGPFAPSSAAERETIIRFADDEARVLHVYSARPATIQQLLRNRDAMLIETHRDPHGRVTGCEFTLPISCLRIRAKRRMSEAQRAALDRARAIARQGTTQQHVASG